MVQKRGKKINFYNLTSWVARLCQATQQTPKSSPANFVTKSTDLIINFCRTYCFDSLVIRLQSKDLKTPHPKNRITRITRLACICELAQGYK